MGTLSKYQIARGRKLYGIFTAFNSISFALVTGNVLSIYAMYLQASALVIGLINAFNFLSFFAIPLGRYLAKKQSIMKVYARAWLARILSVTLMLAIPFLVSSGVPEMGIFCILLSNFCFNFFRGIGTIANNPVISDLAPGKDRGSFMVFLSLIWNTFALLTTLILAFFLQFGDSLVILNAAVTVGIVSGIISAFILFRMPSSDTERKTEPTNFTKNFLTAMHDRSFRLFLIAFMIIGFGVGMARPFIIVYARDVYTQPDSLITFITFFSSLGALCMGLVTRLFIDKIGAKPMYLLFTALTILSLIPAVISPTLENSIVIFVYLCLIAFVSNLGFSGEENAGQTYFFGIIPKEAVLDLSIVYFLVSGMAGASGSLVAGVMLDSFTQSGLSVTAAYRLFFGIQIIIIGISFFIQMKLKALDSYSLKEALPMFFSMRDIRGLSLLYKLDRSKTVREKTELLTELRLSNTSAATTNLLEHLSSPSFAVRSEAIAGMESLPKLNAQTIDILINELDKGLFTTAYRAARILGNFKVKQAVPNLLKCIHSEDYILAGESMVALARIGDEGAQTKISNVLETTKNTHISLWGVRAMEMYANATSIPILQNVLRLNHESNAIENEVMLAFASIMGIDKIFFPAFSQYVDNSEAAEEILQTLFDEITSKKKLKGQSMPPLILAFLHDDMNRDEFSQSIATYAKKSTGMVVKMLLSSLIDTDLPKLESFRFFICFWSLMIFSDPKLLNR